MTLNKRDPDVKRDYTALYVYPPRRVEDPDEPGTWLEVPLLVCQNRHAMSALMSTVM